MITVFLWPWCRTWERKHVPLQLLKRAVSEELEWTPLHASPWKSWISFWLNQLRSKHSSLTAWAKNKITLTTASRARERSGRVLDPNRPLAEVEWWSISYSHFKCSSDVAMDRLGVWGCFNCYVGSRGEDTNVLMKNIQSERDFDSLGFVNKSIKSRFNVYSRLVYWL